MKVHFSDLALEEIIRFRGLLLASSFFAFFLIKVASR